MEKEKQAQEIADLIKEASQLIAMANNRLEEYNLNLRNYPEGWTSFDNHSGELQNIVITDFDGFNYDTDGNRLYYSHETKSVYYLDGDTIMYSNIDKSGKFDIFDFSAVDENLVDSEFIDDTYTRRLRDVYADVRKALK